MKNPIPLNLPNDEDQFKSVPFVHKMTTYQLKVCIKRIWNNLQMLANQMDGRRKDISMVLDNILEGKRWTKKDLDDRYVYGAYEDYILKFDTLNKQFLILNRNHEQVEPTIQGFTRTDLKKLKQEEKANA